MFDICYTIGFICIILIVVFFLLNCYINFCNNTDTNTIVNKEPLLHKKNIINELINNIYKQQSHFIQTIQK